MWCHVERLRRKARNRLTYTSYHNKAGTEEWRIDASSRDAVLCVFKKKSVWLFLWTWHLCDPLRQRRLRVSVNVSCQPMFSLFRWTSSPLHIVFVILFQYAFCLQKNLQNTTSCCTSSWHLYTFYFAIFLSLFTFFFITAKFCSWWYLPFLCCFRFLWVVSQDCTCPMNLKLIREKTIKNVSTSLCAKLC